MKRLLLSLILLSQSFVFVGFKSKLSEPVSAAEYEPFGTESIYLRGKFSGEEVWRNKNENMFIYDAENKTYNLTIELARGDIFSPYQNNRTRFLYFPLDNQSVVDDLLNNGIDKYSNGGSVYYFQALVTGKYTFTIDAFVEQSTDKFGYDIWGADKKSSIKFSFNKNSTAFFAVDSANDVYRVFTKGADPNIKEYGTGFGGELMICTNVSVQELFPNKHLLPIPYDQNFSSTFILYEFSNKEATSPKKLSSEFKLVNNALFTSFSNPNYDKEVGECLGVAYLISSNLKSFVQDGIAYDNCILSISLERAQEILDTYDALNTSQKETIKSIKISYVDDKLVSQNNVSLDHCINYLRKSVAKSKKLSIKVVIIPAVFALFSVVVLFFALSFKKMNGDLNNPKPVLSFYKERDVFDEVTEIDI